MTAATTTANDGPYTSPESVGYPEDPIFASISAPADAADAAACYTKIFAWI